MTTDSIILVNGTPGFVQGCILTDSSITINNNTVFSLLYNLKEELLEKDCLYKAKMKVESTRLLFLTVCLLLGRSSILDPCYFRYLMALTFKCSLEW